jgi:anti-anti-sigma factor
MTPASIGGVAAMLRPSSDSELSLAANRRQDLDMRITRSIGDGVIELAVEGRLDGYWADHLDNLLTEIIREGHHRIRLNLALVTLLTSAAIGVMAKFYKRLRQIDGSLGVTSPSPTVQRLLDITRLGPVLIEPESAAPGATAVQRPGRHLERAGVRFEIFELATTGSLTCRVFGNDEPLRTSAFSATECSSLGLLAPLFAVGIGAFGESFSDCRQRFGELLSVSGATAYQPADGTNVPDYLVAAGPLAPDVRVLYCLTCEGQFTHLLRFETLQPGRGSVGLVELLESCLEIAAARSIGVVIVAEAAGLVGAALRRSPAQPPIEGDFFAHPGIRTRLSFTAERAFLRTVALAAGVVMGPHQHGAGPPQLRPLGARGLLGHMHAAAFPFQPLRKGRIDFRETVSALFETERLLGVLHLLHDDRGAVGAGESEFIRGACWMGPITNEWTANTLEKPERC